MGAIGRWIDARCKEEPEVMRRVLNRRFGGLHYFFGEDGTCGCLVGSYILEGGQQAHRYENGVSEAIPTIIGFKVLDLTVHRKSRLVKRSDAFVVRLLKQRIRKALG